MLTDIQPIQTALPATGIPLASVRADNPFTAHPECGHRTLRVGRTSMSPTVRMETAHMMNCHLVLVETMISAYMQKYATSALQQLREKGLLRHELKKRGNALRDAVQELQRRCKNTDDLLMKEFLKGIHPALVDPFVECGGSFVSNLQVAFDKQFNNLTQKAFFATKNIMDKMRMEHSEIQCSLHMVAMYAHISREYFKGIEENLHSLLDGISAVRRSHSDYGDKVVYLSTGLLSILSGDKKDVTVPEKEGQAARGFGRQIASGLVGDGISDLMDRVLLEFRESYGRFILAHLRVCQHNRTATLTDLRALFVRLGHKEEVRHLLADLSELPYQPEENADLQDVADSFPLFDANTSLGNFVALCGENRCIEVEEPKGVILGRLLRQIAHTEKGILPLEVLRRLYQDMKTKQRMLDYLKEERLPGSAIRMLQQTPVIELRKHYLS